MLKGWLIVVSLSLLVALSGMISCDSGNPPTPEVPDLGTEEPADNITRESNFNLIFRYGIMSGNTLDTFQGTYIKDMVRDPSIRIDLALTKEEMDRIYEKMVEIDFFNYPDRFSVSVPPGVPTGIRTPYSSYYFKVEYNSKIKELWWNDEIVKEDEKADRLRELISFIRDIVESKEEYQKLPEPTSAYQ